VGHQVVVVTRSFGTTSNEPWEILADHDCEVVRVDEDASDSELLSAIASADGLIVGGRFITADLIDRSPQLRVISKHGVGVDHIDIEAAAAHGIVVTNTPGANANGVADLTIALMLAVARPILSGNAALRRGEWGRYPGVELWQKTLGLIGLGAIGTAVAKRAAGFDMRVLVYDPFIGADTIREVGAEEATLDDLLSESDFVSLHVPLTGDTRAIITTSSLSHMKPTAYLINTARGELVDEDALYAALIDGRIAGAGLDVFANEPPVGNDLVDLPNVVATPHIGSHSAESTTNVSTMAAENTVLVLEGRPPISQVNPTLNGDLSESLK
jgi:D-3-phosphoglycerate dehydrogenase